MPVRTRRGRAAAYRAVWTWPLSSPQRFLGVVALAALLVALLAALGGTPGPAAVDGTDGPGRTAARSGAGSGGGAVGGSGAAPLELTPTRLPPADAPAAALTAAQRWTAAWAAPPVGVPPDRWLAGLRPWTTDEYLPVLASTDPANVPATRLIGAAAPVEVRPDSVRVRVPTDAGRVGLLLVQVAPGQWRVTAHDPAG